MPLLNPPFGLHELAAHRDALAVSDFERTRTFQELAERSGRFAAALRAEGIGPGAHLAVCMENRVEYFEVVLGAVLAGALVTPVNHHLADEEVAYVLADAGARLVVTCAVHRARVERVCARVVEVGPCYEAFLASAAPGLAAVDDAPPGGTMIYTSGTSGRPKGVVRSRAATVAGQLASYRHAGARFGLDGHGPHLVTGPLYHAAPLLFALYDLLNGASVYVLPRWDAARALHALAELRVAHVHLVPTMFVRLLALPEPARRAFDTRALRLVLHGAAPTAPDLKRRMLAWWGATLVEYWGATEGGIYTMCRTEEWLERPGTVGRPLEGLEVFAASDAGARLPAGEAGMLYCRHRHEARPFVYHQDARKTEAAYGPRGEFTAGDLGHVDEAGYVHLSERRSNLILSGGVNIYPAEVERVLADHPAVLDVVVFGVPDPEWGEQVRAAVELRVGFAPSPALAAALMAFARARLAGFKVPREVHFEAPLPRLPSGKLYVERLRAKHGG